MGTLRAGGIDVVQLSEWEDELWTRGQLFPQSTRESWEANQDWLVPVYWHPVTDIAILVSQIYAFTSEGLKVVVDTGIGNDKERPVPPWSHLHTDIPQRLTDAGYAPDTVDIVVCTHLHIDHVGWNTQLADGRWLPTFPNARYIFHQSDLERLKRLSPSEDQLGEVPALNDSVMPVIEAGLVESWDGESYRINDELQLLRTPGHTPGNSVLVLERGGEVAVFSGDIVHHPIQILQPETPVNLDGDSTTAMESRRRILSLAADRDAVLLPAHFPGARGVRVSAEGTGFTIREWVPLA